MITNNTTNSLEQSLASPTIATTSNNIFSQWPTQIAEAITNESSFNNTLISPSTNNIADYQIDNLHEETTFSRMKKGLPSTLDFLKLCNANNQQLAANQLNSMLKQVANSDIFNWENSLLTEHECNFNHKDNYDLLNQPLSIAAKYGNTPVCKVLIKHLKPKSHSKPMVRFIEKTTRRFINGLLPEYNGVIARAEADNCYSALEKALEYNNFETAEYLYNAYKGYVIKGYYNGLNYIREIFTYELLGASKNIPQLQFVLQKIKSIDNLDKLLDAILSNKLLIATVSWAKDKNWDLVAYIIAEHMDIIKNGTTLSKKEFLYEALKNKKFDIAADFIKNISIDILYETEKFTGNEIFRNYTFVDAVKQNLDTETTEWLLKAIH